MPAGVIPPGMSREEYSRYSLAERRRISRAERERRADRDRIIDLITEPEPDTTSPLQPGDRVRVNDDPRAFVTGGWVDPQFANRTVIVVRSLNHADSYEVQLRSGHTNSIWRGSLSLIERAPEVGPAPIAPIVTGSINIDTSGLMAWTEIATSAMRDLSVDVSPRETPVEQRFRCHECMRWHDNASDVSEHYCVDCRRTCSDCGQTLSTYSHDFHDFYGTGTVCDGCYGVCPGCGDYYRHEDGGPCCPESGSGIDDYMHTRPSMWLGGPTPKLPDGTVDISQPGSYYVGFELEISANLRDGAMHVHEWAKEHLGHENALHCKEDSSVDGYEIVSQPMTPKFFESVDWDSLMKVLNDHHPIRGEEPTEHGLHVHIGRIAFGRDDVATAAYSYLLAQGTHLERIGRRRAYHYCAKVEKPVTVAIAHGASQGTGRQTKQSSRLSGYYAGRDAINLQNGSTIEIRAFKSTRDANELRDAVRLTYVAAEYIRHLRIGKQAISPKALHWSQFAQWTAANHPAAFVSIAGIEAPKNSTNSTASGKALVGAVNTNH